MYNSQVQDIDIDTPTAFFFELVDVPFGSAEG